MSGGLLSAFVGAARRSAGERARGAAARDVEREAAVRQPRPQVFREALRQPGCRIIAECKRRSPSRGVLRSAYDPVSIASGYAAAGAAAISVLTEPTFFDGSLDHLRAVRARVETPLLCKDFTVTEFQIVEARAAGADAVLLIVAALDDATLALLLRLASDHRLAALVEVHGEVELQRALEAGVEIVGVNSRDLRTLDVSRTTFDALAGALPPGVVAVAESGVRTAEDIRRLRALRYDAFLMGERFMTAENPGEALAMMLADVAREVSA